MLKLLSEETAVFCFVACVVNVVTCISDFRSGFDLVSHLLDVYQAEL
jgi:hypothetical protein